MYRLKENLVTRGVISYDVYLDDVKLDCSMISSIRFRPREGQYGLAIGKGCVNVISAINGRIIAQITAGNGLYNVIGCKLFIGKLVAGVLCVKGHQHLMELREVVRRTKKENRKLIIE